MSDRPRQKLRLLFDDDVLALLSEIAAHDAHAAALAEEVFRRRRDQGGDVADWVAHLEQARQSILGGFGRTRLAYIAADELGIWLEPEPEGEPSQPPPARAKPNLLDDLLGAPARPRRGLLE